MNDKKIDFWPSDSNGVYICCGCGDSMGADYEPPTCCGGHECGCMGQPTEPNICSNKCWEKVMGSRDE